MLYIFGVLVFLIVAGLKTLEDKFSIISIWISSITEDVSLFFLQANNSCATKILTIASTFYLFYEKNVFKLKKLDIKELI